MKFQIDSPTVELERNEMFKIEKETLLIGQWKRSGWHISPSAEPEKPMWFDTKLTIENVDLRELLGALADRLKVKIVEEEEIV